MSQGCPRIPPMPQTQAIAIVLGCPSQLDGKTLLLKRQHTLVRVQRNQAELVWTLAVDLQVKMCVLVYSGTKALGVSNYSD